MYAKLSLNQINKIKQNFSAFEDVNTEIRPTKSMSLDQPGKREI